MGLTHVTHGGVFKLLVKLSIKFQDFPIGKSNSRSIGFHLAQKTQETLFFSHHYTANKQLHQLGSVGGYVSYVREILGKARTRKPKSQTEYTKVEEFKS